MHPALVLPPTALRAAANLLLSQVVFLAANLPQPQPKQHQQQQPKQEGEEEQVGLGGEGEEAGSKGAGEAGEEWAHLPLFTQRGLATADRALRTLAALAGE